MNPDFAVQLVDMLLADHGPPSADSCPAQEYPISAMPNPLRPQNTVLYGLGLYITTNLFDLV